MPPAHRSRHYRDVWEITRLALRYALRRFKLAESVVHEDALMQEYAKVELHPQSQEVLHELQRRGITTAILTNGIPETMGAAIHHAGFEPYLDAVLSSDTLHQYKILPSIYELVLQRNPQHRTNEVLFVSSKAWNALGATWTVFETL